MAKSLIPKIQEHAKSDAPILGDSDLDDYAQSTHRGHKPSSILPDATGGGAYLGKDDSKAIGDLFDMDEEEVPDEYVYMSKKRQEDGDDWVAAHEYGHAQKPQNIVSKAGKKGYKPSKILTATGASTVGSMIAASEGGGKVRKYAPLAPAIAAAPMLIEEARANIGGDRLMRKALEGDPDRKKKLRESRKGMAGSFGSYLAAPALGSALTYGAGKLSDKLEEV